MLVVLEDFLPEMLSKVGVLDERSVNKSKKNHARATAESPSTVKNNKFARFGAADPPDPPIRCHQLLLGTPFPRAPGAKMT